MSVKSMLPILGVGSAFAILGLAAARRHAHTPNADANAPRGQRSSGVHPRVALDDVNDAELAALTPELTNDFWDATPESYMPESHMPESYSLADMPSRPPSELETYDALDTEDLSAEWLTRATEAPAGAQSGAFDIDDPAEIAADSMSMISDASRRAAALDLDELVDADDSAADSRA